jgi:dihydroorotate dehydrogenase electron transfer subunit
MGWVDMVYSCGPLPMLRAIDRLAEELGVRCEVSLEEHMACGFGACMGCVVPVRSGADASVYKRVCHDGPVFESNTLAWEEMR